MEDNPAVPGGTIAGRYTIERELGRGGAAIVFLARDRRQERQVAVKVLHRELGQAIGAQRFLREIKHSSALHHPHLLSIHESGESDGLLYYVMPFMRDGSLRTRIAKEKQLAVDESLRITRQVGEALSYAHSQGIVHRDIKPDNVLFSADHACLADFGIARAVDSVAADTLTSTGLVVGTPAYMSPEQASGEREVDARSDQYSLACLLYEMITGLPPFIGATMQSVISQRFTQPPPSMRAHRPSVPDDVERAVKRAMATTPADRFPSVADFVAALHDHTSAVESVSVHSVRRRWFAVGAAAAIATAAVMAAGPGSDWVRGAWGVQVDTTKFVVLPFLSDADSADGVRVAAAIQAGLQRWEDLGLERDITVRDAVEKSGRITSLDDAYAIARELGAGRLVWGRVGASGGGLSVSAGLYDVATRAGLSERRVLLPSRDVVDTSLYRFATSLISGRAIPRGLDDGERGTNSYNAWQAYRRGAIALGSWNLQAAEAGFVDAIEADPDFGVAHYWAARVTSWLRPDSSRTWSGSAARAVALKTELSIGDTRRSEALLAFSRGDYPLACEHYRRLVGLDTLDARAWYGLGECLHADTLVVADPRSESGFRFRSSWHSAGIAFLRAFEIDPRMHAIPQFRRLRQLFQTESSRLRPGGIGSSALAGYPYWIGDSLAFIPFPASEFSRGSRPATEVSQQARALARNQRIVRSLAATWAATYPNSPEAHTALASVLEVSGELESALASVGKARSLPAPELDQLILAETEVRLRYKSSDFEIARLVADSALMRFGKVTLQNWEPIARIAGLTGKAGKLGEALRHYWEKYEGVEDLDPSVAGRAGELLASAGLGHCAPRTSELHADVQAIIESRVQPERHAEISEKVMGAPATFLMSCTEGQSMRDVIPGFVQIKIAQHAYARGNFAAARSTLSSIAQGRAQRRPGDVSVDLTARESWLRIAMGDTSGGIALLDGTLGALPTISSAILSHPLESAVLVSTMVRRADLAAAAGDAHTARKWAGAAAALWAGADPVLQPTVERMRRMTLAR